MILQALVRQYEDLLARGEIAAPGWSSQKISYALYINDEGELEQAVSIRQKVDNGKKEILVPQSMNLPEGVKRSSGIASNFLWDNSSYILGITDCTLPSKEQKTLSIEEQEAKKRSIAERAVKCFEACKVRHIDILSNVNSPAAEAVIRFFEKWDCSKAMDHPALAAGLKDILAGGNLVFRYKGQYVHDIPEIREGWNTFHGRNEDAEKTRCLITGKIDNLAILHPAIKGVRGAQATGASLVSFNADAFCSYNHSQGENAPTGAYASFAYGSALNYMLSDYTKYTRLGDTTIVSWAEGAEPAYGSLLSCCTMGSQAAYTEEEISEMIRSLVLGKTVEYDDTLIDPEKPFYILGLAPNAARLSVRFFYRNSFGTIIRNVESHRERLQIAGMKQTPSLWALLSETVRDKKKDEPTPRLSGDLLRAIMMDTPYPATLLNGIIMRIRADRELSTARAGIIKAYYMKNSNPDVPEEVLTVALNKDSNNIPYLLGRLFSVLEDIQQTANPGINSTIKDKYFNSAEAVPAVVFPTLLNLANKHLRKIGGGLQVVKDKELQEIMSKIGDEFPATLSLPQQGSFQLGYYHQKQARYQKKGE